MTLSLEVQVWQDSYGPASDSFMVSKKYSKRYGQKYRNCSCIQLASDRRKWVKNDEIVPIFILQLLYVANAGPEDRPQYYFRSGTVTWHPPAIFPFCNKFLNRWK